MKNKCNSWLKCHILLEWNLFKSHIQIVCPPPPWDIRFWSLPHLAPLFKDVQILCLHLIIIFYKRPWWPTSRPSVIEEGSIWQWLSRSLVFLRSVTGRGGKRRITFFYYRSPSGSCWLHAMNSCAIETKMSKAFILFSSVNSIHNVTLNLPTFCSL